MGIVKKKTDQPICGLAANVFYTQFWIVFVSSNNVLDPG